METKASEDVRTTILVPRDTMDRLKARVRSQERTVSQTIRLLIHRFLEEEENA
jgi:predicted DNA-binding protein